MRKVTHQRSLLTPTFQMQNSHQSHVTFDGSLLGEVEYFLFTSKSFRKLFFFLSKLTNVPRQLGIAFSQDLQCKSSLT